jgi:hypothetical protein
LLLNAHAEGWWLLNVDGKRSAQREQRKLEANARCKSTVVAI